MKLALCDQKDGPKGFGRALLWRVSPQRVVGLRGEIAEVGPMMRRPGPVSAMSLGRVEDTEIEAAIAPGAAVRSHAKESDKVLERSSSRAMKRGSIAVLTCWGSLHVHKKTSSLGPEGTLRRSRSDGNPSSVGGIRRTGYALGAELLRSLWEARISSAVKRDRKGAPSAMASMFARPPP